ncbi:hypothetical protein [Sphingobium algorifonticola]|uniref:Uncharacterized protein n=1 Tax=Sphingobium algorifonticola TaxID=2008318 RepID=A0A437JCL2_9SPHN|nr:hypothetical protein [Sphingobium algorifonticola]RVT43604.1 hypothetical protein ENE74_03030 [Sphingobium algorifonticola]
MPQIPENRKIVSVTLQASGTAVAETANPFVDLKRKQYVGAMASRALKIARRRERLRERMAGE